MSKNQEVETEETLPHQLGMLLIGALAGFAATKFANYAYKTVLEAYRNREAATPI